MAKQRALEFLEYTKWVENAKRVEENKRKWTLEQMAADTLKVDEAKQRQLREKSHALEMEVRQTQLQQMKQKGKSTYRSSSINLVIDGWMCA